MDPAELLDLRAHIMATHPKYTTRPQFNPSNPRVPMTLKGDKPNGPGHIDQCPTNTATADAQQCFLTLRTDGCLDNRSMPKIFCNACGENIDPEEWLVCMPCGRIDLHVSCAEWRLEGQNCWDTTRTMHYSERMEEYIMQERMSALKINPRHMPLMAREPRMATLEPVVK
tara:strand:- start:12 stop:521 length:510 start_codon:yes stop_codon:yes gene_type:complete